MTTMEIENQLTFSRRPYRNENLKQVLEFARDNGLPPHQTQANFKRFLTQLCSGPEKVIEIFCNERMVAAGVLLDRVQNPAHTVPFELLGLDPQFAEPAYRTLLAAAEKELPLQSAGMTVFHHFMHPFGDELLMDRGYKPYLNTYSMMLRHPQAELGKLPLGVRLEPLKLEMFDFYFEVVRETFSKSIEVSVPSREEFLRTTMAKDVPPLLLYEKAKLVGFVTISVDEREPEIGHIDTLGVVSSARRRGFGRCLLTTAIQALVIEKVKRVNLEVSASNPDALRLYESLGFHVVDRFAGFIWQRPRA